MRPNALCGILEYRTALAERKPHKLRRAVRTEEGRQRDRGNPRFARDTFAKCAVGLVGEIADGRGDEIGAFAGRNLKSRALQRRSYEIALVLQLASVLQRIVHFVLESVRHPELQCG